MTVYTDFAEIPPLSYDLIMADPPWSFDNWSERGEAKNAKAHYRCESVDALKAMDVASLASKDCLLWLWATNPMLRQAHDLLDAWGFIEKTAGHWVKTTKHGKLAFGTGYIFRCSGEPYLIGTIGRPKTANNIRSVLMAPVREHSRKPDEAFTTAEALVPGAVRRLELFSRQPREGWDVFGDEVDKFGGSHAA